MNDAIQEIDRQMGEIVLTRMLMRIDARLLEKPFSVEEDELLGRKQWHLWAKREGLVSDEIRTLLSPESKTVNDRGFAFPVFIKAGQ